jgi:hypothetical protein
MDKQQKVPDKDILIHIDKLFNDSIVAHNEMISQISMFMIRWLVVINGSACIALLALIGNVWGKIDKTSFITAIMPSIALFASGTIVALLVAGGLYFNIYYIAIGLRIGQQQILAQIRGENSEKLNSTLTHCNLKVQIFRWLAIILTIFSMVLFVWGGKTLYCNLYSVLTK